METARKVTAAFIVSTLVFVTIYDAFAAYKFGVGATISAVTLSAAHSYPILPFLTGIVAGHLFWPQTKN